MIDGRHSGLAYHDIARATYLSPTGKLGLVARGAANGLPNPSRAAPVGTTGGLSSSSWPLASISTSMSCGSSGRRCPVSGAFLAIDPTPGTTGIPRIIDKVLWEQSCRALSNRYRVTTRFEQHLGRGSWSGRILLKA